MWQYFFWAENKKWQWRYCIVAPIYAILFIYFEPLKGNIVKYENAYVNNIVFLLISTFYNYLAVFIVPKLAPNFFKRETWTLKKFYIWFIIFASLASLMAYAFDINIENVENKLDWSINYYFFYQIPIACFTFAPMLVFFIFFDPTPIVKEKIAPIEITPTNITSNEIIAKEEKILNIKDTNDRVELTINLSQLYFFKASDNYIEIFHKNTEGPFRIVIRNSLKDIENQFLDVPQLFRCHKAYIVNTEKVIEISGNAKGYFLTLEKNEEKIPVSRSNIDALKQRLPTFFA
jgi:LytTr DNA-binding domain